MPNPLTVQVVVDESLAVSGVISTTGGTLTAQAADNTKFTLTFPEGALLNDEDITLTPVTSVEGLPFSGGLVGGVQMAPEGLRLMQPATLTIQSPKTVAAAGFETVAFAYHQNGEGLYLNPSNATGNTLTLEIWHFCAAFAAALSGQGALLSEAWGETPINVRMALHTGAAEARDANYFGSAMLA